MRTAISGLTTSRVLESIQPGLSHIYRKNLSTSSKQSPIFSVEYIPLATKVPAEYIKKLFLDLPQKARGDISQILDLSSREIKRVSIQDVELSFKDQYGTITLASLIGATIKYGEYGKMPSKSVSPLQLLNNKLHILPKSVGVLNIRKHVPFLIETPNPSQTLALCTGGSLSIVGDYKTNMNNCSLKILLNLDEDEAMDLSLGMQIRIQKDRNKEKFYEETTSKITEPTSNLPFSATLMNFATSIASGFDNTTMHYHPGDRMLIICTTNQPAGVKLNFCGVKQAPDDHPDTEIIKDFPPNAMSVIIFPAYVHHKFFGQFTCISVHPKDGLKFIKEMTKGNLSKGFLESATTFSEKPDGEKELNSLLSKQDAEYPIIKSKIYR